MMRSPMQTFPLKIVGGNAFGRYPKISSESTYNMIVSDGWLVPFAGYKKVVQITDTDISRGIYTSARQNNIYMVVGRNVYLLNRYLRFLKIGALETSEGDVFISENDNNQIGFCDLKNIYMYDGATFSKAALDFIPGYLDFHDSRFMSVEKNNPRWRLSAPGDGLSWPSDPNSIGTFQTKPDDAVAVISLPGKANQIFVIGNTVTESWTDIGYQIFPYQRNSSFNIDYGCVNPATIAKSETFVCWLGRNEKSGIEIMYSSGGNIITIATDGIIFKLDQLINPEASYASIYRLDGHLMYHLTFTDPDDNLSIIYDFNTQLFYYLTNECMNKHIAKQVVFFNNKYYFISFIDGNLYELSNQYYTYDGNEIPRIRVCNNIRHPDSSSFILKEAVFTIEQGESSEIQRVDMSVSRDGGVAFGNIYGMQLNPLGRRKNIFRKWNLGFGNDFVIQYRFWGKGRFAATNGLVRMVA